MNKKIILNGEAIEIPVTIPQTVLDEKQDKLTGSVGQLVGFDSNGLAIAQDAPSEGLTEEEANALYLKQIGGAINGYLEVESYISTSDKLIIKKADNNGSNKVKLYIDANGKLAFQQELNGSGLMSIAPTHITGVNTPTSDDDAVNKRYVDALIPPGVIVMWSGTSVPDGWAICDGTNGTPDLRDKFVLSAGTAHNVGETGGSEEVTLTVDQMPKHRHQYTGYTSDTIKYSTGSTSAYVDSSTSAIRLTDMSGKDQPHPNMPPYYTLYYIMKL